MKSISHYCKYFIQGFEFFLAAALAQSSIAPIFPPTGVLSEPFTFKMLRALIRQIPPLCQGIVSSRVERWTLILPRANHSSVSLFFFRSRLIVVICRCFKPISARSCVIWLPLACVDGTAHASFALVLGTIWQWGGFSPSLAGSCFTVCFSWPPVYVFWNVIHIHCDSSWGLCDTVSVCLKGLKLNKGYQSVEGYGGLSCAIRLGAARFSLQRFSLQPFLEVLK